MRQYDRPTLLSRGTEISRFVRGEKQIIPCVGGHKYFSIDWDLNIWRCEAWPEPMGSVFDLDHLSEDRSPCNACMMACYRHASALMHGAVALTDAFENLRTGHIAASVKAITRPGVLPSLWAVLTEKLLRRST